jgi:hypothetical protein
MNGALDTSHQDAWDAFAHGIWLKGLRDNALRNLPGRSGGRILLGTQPNPAASMIEMTIVPNAGHGIGAFLVRLVGPGVEASAYVDAEDETGEFKPSDDSCDPSALLELARQYVESYRLFAHRQAISKNPLF